MQNEVMDLARDSFVANKNPFSQIVEEAKKPEEETQEIQTPEPEPVIEVSKEEPEPIPEPIPTPKFKVGDRVKIVGSGNANSYGTGHRAGGIGWHRYITKIYEGRAYPYQVGNKGKTDSLNTTGFYKEDALEIAN